MHYANHFSSEMPISTSRKQRHYCDVLGHASPIIETEIPDTFSPQSGFNTFTVYEIKVMSHFAKNALIFA